MSRPIDRLARWVDDDQLFLGSALVAYARDEGLNDAALAERLGCTPDALTRLRLCYRPRAGRFREDVAALAAKFGARELVLVQAIRRAEALIALQDDAAGASPTLIAARDHDCEDQ